MSDVKMIGGADYIQASGLIARGYSKIVLTPQDINGGITDIVQAIVLLGVSFKTDGPVLINGQVH